MRYAVLRYWKFIGICCVAICLLGFFFLRFGAEKEPIKIYKATTPLKISRIPSHESIPLREVDKNEYSRQEETQRLQPRATLSEKPEASSEQLVSKDVISNDTDVEDEVELEATDYFSNEKIELLVKELISDWDNFLVDLSYKYPILLDSELIQVMARTKCTAIGNLDHSLNQDCAIIQSY